MVHPKCKLGAEETSILASNISGGWGGGGRGENSKSKGQHEGSRSASSEAGN